MPTMFPLRRGEGFTQQGQTSQRQAAVMFNNVESFTPALAIPKNIGATTFTTDTFNVAGFNCFMALLDVTVANITFKVNHVDPRDQTTVLFTRSIVTVAFGTGFNLITFGFGSAAASAGQDVFLYIQLAFTGAGANATINQFPGLWGSVR
jgi:hypothetical protein